MYKIYASKGNQTICIYNDEFMTDEVKVVSPSLSLTESNAGELSMKIPSTNTGYDFIERLDTELYITKNDTEVWRGRVLTMKEDFYKNKTIKCEGELAYLNDTTQPQRELVNLSPANKLTAVLDHHNSKSGKKFYTGIVTVTDPNNTSSDYTNYESTMSFISSRLIDKYGGYIHLRKVSGTNYIDYLQESDRPTASQDVRFGDNLLDFTKSFDSTDFCTVVLPLGKQIGTEYADDGTSIGTYVTIESVNNNSPYLINQTAVNQFGWIEKVVNYNDIEDPEELMLYGQLYLSASQFDNMVLEVNAVDLAYMGVVPENIQLSDKVHVVSSPHGLDRYFPVTKMSIPLDHPENTSFTMGTEIKVSMSAKSVSGNNSIYEKFNTYSQYVATSMNTVIEQARTQADQLIKTHTRGYITITTDQDGSNALYITDKRLEDGYNPDDPTSQVSKYWVWNMGGLGFYNKADPGSGLRIALTNDGAINADRITTGSLSANIIQTGILTGSGNSGSFSLNMETGALTMNNGTFTGSFTAGNTSTGPYFQCNSSGIRWADSYSSKTFDGHISMKEATVSGTINLGGSIGYNGVLNLYDSSGFLKYSLDQNYGLYSYGKNSSGSLEYKVYYGYSGSFSDDSGDEFEPVPIEIASGSSVSSSITNWMSNGIAFLEQNSSTPFCLIGIGNSKKLILRTESSSIHIQANNDLFLNSKEDVTITGKDIYLDVTDNLYILKNYGYVKGYTGTISFKISASTTLTLTFVNGILTEYTKSS